MSFFFENTKNEKHLRIFKREYLHLINIYFMKKYTHFTPLYL